MIISLLYIFLAGLGLSFLVFIHELGHYIVARRVGMRVEVFSIGFGKPLITWTQQGVKWQICWLLFGGYVKIAGMEKEKGKEPYEIKDGFYGKAPLARIKVALMGPLVNIVFALGLFSLIWMMGGRMKPFEEYTHIIGWVDPTSELAGLGVKPGDTISRYNYRNFSGFKSLLYNSVLKGESVQIEGEKIDYAEGTRTPYNYQLQPYPDHRFLKGMQTIGVLNPASTLLFGGFSETEGAASPAYNVGLHKGDRIVWADGQVLFSLQQLSHIVNQDRAFLTVERKGAILQLSIERLPFGDFQLTALQKEEIRDWRRALHIKDQPQDLFFIPYWVNDDAVVQSALPLIEERELQNGEKPQELMVGDRIIAVSGKSIENAKELLDYLRTREVLLVVQRADKAVPASDTEMTWKNEDELFMKSVDWKALNDFTATAGLKDKKMIGESFVFLTPIQPVTYKEYLLNLQEFNSKEGLHHEVAKATGALATLQDKVVAKRSARAARLGEKESANLARQYIMAGALMEQQFVIYNPEPLEVFNDVLQDTWFTLSSLVTGSLSPKWLSGPVGIIKVMHDGWAVGVKEALYWMGLISLNLGLINLLPIPVLDGGHICFSLWEAITRKRISSKAMERMILPFVVLLVFFFVYVTYQDLSRLFFH